MTKETKLRHRKMVLLALASVALLTPVGRVVAQTITPQLDDLILGFRATEGMGAGTNLEVDLGNMSQFYDAAQGSTFPLPLLQIQDLSDAYGASWSTRTDLVWGAVATTGRLSGTPDSYAPVGTLWATAPDGQPGWNDGSIYAQKAASQVIETMIEPGSIGTLYGASKTTNSPFAADINATQPGSYKAQDLKTAGVSFGYFNPTVDNAMPTNGLAVSDLYELRPGSGAGTELGQLELTQNGMSYFAIVPEPSAGMLVVLGLGCSVVLIRRMKASRV